MAGTYSNLNFHVVFSTKNRDAIITPELEQELYPYIAGILKGEEGILLKIGGTENHVLNCPVRLNMSAIKKNTINESHLKRSLSGFLKKMESNTTLSIFGDNTSPLCHGVKTPTKLQSPFGAGVFGIPVPGVKTPG
jgi:phosphotransferase system IIB component